MIKILKINSILAATMLLNPIVLSIISAPSIASANVISATTDPKLLAAQAVGNYSCDLVTNANNVNTGSALALTLQLTNNSDSSVIPAGTTFVININAEAIDYSTINFSDPTLNKFFSFQSDPITGTITLSLKQDIVGNGTQVNPIIHAAVTGQAGKSYKIGIVSSDGSSVPITNDTINISDSSGPPYTYGAINSYWGIHQGLNGNFIGKASSQENTGIFSHTEDVINIFGEFNTDFKQWGEFLDGSTHWVTLTFDYDSKEQLDVSSIAIYNKSKGYTTIDYTTNSSGDGDKPIVQVNESNHQFTVTFKSSIPVGGDQSQDVVSIGYDATVKDDTLTYDNSMSLNNELGDTIDSFLLHSIFSRQGASDVFPTVISKDLTYSLGQLTETNIAKTLIRDSGASALDTIDGSINPSNISVDTSQVNFDEPGTYEVTYKVTNSSGNTGGGTYHVTIIAPTIAANVTIRYVDQSGKVIHDPQVITGNVDDKYDTTIPSYKLQISGYTLDTTKLPTNAVGNLTANSQTVTYVYTKDPVKAANATVRYVDQSGKVIHDPQVITGNIDDKYDATTPTYKLQISGYTLDTAKLPTNTVGKLTTSSKTLTYVYTKDPVKAANATVRYVDQSGKVIHDPQVITGNIDDKYDATTPTYKLQISGYTLDTAKLPTNASGILAGQEQIITYVYTHSIKIPSSNIHSGVVSNGSLLPKMGENDFNSIYIVLFGLLVTTTGGIISILTKYLK